MDLLRLRGSKFLVTGGTGFIGRALVRALLKEGAVVRSLDNDSRGARDKLAGLGPNLQTVEGDIRDIGCVRESVAGVDGVFHLAYINGTEFFYQKPDLILEVAVKGMMNILDACIEEGVRTLVLASSSEVYQTPPLIPTDEAVPLIVPDIRNPRYSYGGGKIISELLAANYGRKHFDRTIIFRPHNVYGPDMGWEHVIPQFSTRMMKLASEFSGPINFPIQGTGDETRSFIYIDDFTDALLRVVRAGHGVDVYHIGTSEEVSIGHLAKMVGKIFKREVNLVPGDLQPGSTLRRCPDVSKLARLGFTPKFNLATGLEKTISWYRKHHLMNKEHR